MNTFTCQHICTGLVAGLPERTRNIVIRRFGLEGVEPETLESIGQSHGVTRERVRQIVEDGLVVVRQEAAQGGKQAERLETLYHSFEDVLREAGYMKRQDLLIEALNQKEAYNHIVFLLHVYNQLYQQKETEHTHAFWVSKEDVWSSVLPLLRDLVAYLEERNSPATLEELHAYQDSVEKATFASLLEVSKHILQGYNGKWGLRKWPEIYPKGMKDKAYVVLRDSEKPLHFVEVSKLIEALQGAFVGQRERNVLPQTVHNELIKDPRFVLVGRGTYGLSEWGYTAGTVKEVLMHILKEHGLPLSRENLIQKTLEQRQVKESTIALNLQDRTCFLRDDNGLYCLAK